MINWKAYPKNKPDKVDAKYLIWAVGDDGSYGIAKAEWNGEIFLGYAYSLRATHFTEINPPSEPINQDSVYGC